MTTDDLLRELEELLRTNKNTVATLTTAVGGMTAILTSLNDKKSSGALDFDDLKQSIHDSMMGAMKPVIAEMMSAGSRGGGGGGGEGGEGGGEGERGGGGGGRDFVGAISQARIAEGITGRLEKLQESTRELFSWRDTFRDSRERQIQVLEGIVVGLHQDVVNLLSGQKLHQSFLQQWAQSQEDTQRGIGGMWDVITHNWEGATTNFGNAAQTFAGGAISFSQAVKLITGSDGFYARFDGDRQEFSRQVADSMDRVEVAMRARGESIYDYQTGEQFRQMLITMQNLYGLNVQTADRADNIRRLDTPNNIRRTQQQLDFLRQVARNTGKSVEELQAMNASEDDLEMANKAGLNEEQSALIGRLNTISELSGNPRFMENIRRAMSGVATGRGIGAFADDPEALVRGEASAAIRLINEVMRGNTDLHELIEEYSQSINEQSVLNNVGTSYSVRGNRRMLDVVDRVEEDAARNDQNSFINRLGNMFQDFFENQAMGQTLMAGAGIVGSLTTATNANTLATWALTNAMGGRGLLGVFRNMPTMFANIFSRIGRFFGLRGLATGAQVIGDGAAAGAAGGGGLLSAAGGIAMGILRTGGRIGVVSMVIDAVMGLFDGTNSVFSRSLSDSSQAAFADLASNIVKLVGSGLLIAAGAIPALIGFLFNRIWDFFNLGELFGLGDGDLFESAGILINNIFEGLKNLLTQWFGADFLKNVGDAISGIFGGIARFLGIVEDDVEEQADDAEEEANRSTEETDRNITRIVLAANQTRRVVFPENGRRAEIDINNAMAALRSTPDSQQRGVSDEEMLHALLSGQRLQQNQLQVLQSLDRELRAQGRGAVIFDTDTTGGRAIGQR